MKYISCILSLFGLIICTNLFGQDNPSEENVLKAMKTVKAFNYELDINANDIYEIDEPITFIHGNFSGLNRKECLAICPIESKRRPDGNNEKFIILFFKIADGTWVKGKFSSFINQVDTMDLNNDKLPELICKTGFTVLLIGMTFEQTSIFQLKGDNETELYSNKSEDRSSDLKVGQESTKIYEIFFIDTNNDGIMELEENFSVGTVKLISNNQPTISYQKSKRILKLINGKYQ